MPLISKKELISLKLESMNAKQVKGFACSVDIPPKGSKADLMERLMAISEDKLDSFIRDKYEQFVRARRDLIPDEDLKKELLNVEAVDWGVVQGELDGKIQRNYVRRYFRYSELLSAVDSGLIEEVRRYVVSTWYNHWTTVLIEDHISKHPRVIPTLKENFPFDIFFDDQPFDLKVTYLPQGYPLETALKFPKGLAVWLYEHQGAQRFSSNNRLFLVLADKNRLHESWKLKRDFEWLFRKVDEFFDSSHITPEDEINFSYRRTQYLTVSKTLVLTR